MHDQVKLLQSDDLPIASDADPIKRMPLIELVIFLLEVGDES